MTLLGKIFTMLIFIAALVWMALSVALYMTQKNWKDVVVRPKEQATGADKPLGLQHQKKQLEETIKRLQEEYAALQDTLYAERAARASALAALEESVQSEIALRRGAEQTAVALNEAHRQAVLTARYDNLGKGASGAAVQNLGLMLGVPVTATRPAAAE